MNNTSNKTVTGKNLILSIVLNVLITTAQFIGGIVSGSLSLLSDALHNFTDVISLVISYIAHRLAGKKASHHMTFGYKRAELIAAFVNAITLVVIAIFLIIEAIKRFSEPQIIDYNLVIWLSFIAIFANGFSVLLLKKDAKRNINMKSAYLHLFTDMLASIAVLVGGILMKLFDWFWIDSVLTFLIAVYLIFVGLDLLRTSTKMLMLFTPEHIDINEIVREVHKLPQVGKLHHIHVWHLNDDELHLEAHLDFKENIDLASFNIVLECIESVLQEKFGINHITIQPEHNKIDPKDYIVQD